MFKVDTKKQIDDEEGNFLTDKAKKVIQGTLYDILQKNEIKSRLFLVKWEKKKSSYVSGEEIMKYAPELIEEMQNAFEN